MKPSKDRLLETVTFVVPGSDDVTYTHAVFAQPHRDSRQPISDPLNEVWFHL